jgi:hypothetical protein
MYPVKVQGRANAPIAARYRSVAPAGLTGPSHQPRHRPRAAGIASRPRAAGIASRVRALLISRDFRQLAGPMAVFLWPPRHDLGQG